MLNSTTLSFDEIIKNTKLISTFEMVEYTVLATTLVIIFFLVFYIIPINQIKSKFNKTQNEIKNKKKLLNKIITQQQIEWEIEEEIKKLNLKD